MGRPRNPPFDKQYETQQDGCWLWTGSVMKNGYAVHHGQLVHRKAHERWIGPIPQGYQVDHLCHDPAICVSGDECLHRRCVNPAHLRAVTPRQNTLRSNSQSARNAVKTHCPAGHPYNETNTHVDKKGMRHCRVCDRDRHMERRHKSPAVAVVGDGS